MKNYFVIGLRSIEELRKCVKDKTVLYLLKILGPSLVKVYKGRVTHICEDTGNWKYRFEYDEENYSYITMKDMGVLFYQKEDVFSEALKRWK